MISPGTIGSVGCSLHQRQPGTESPLGHGPKARPRQEIKRPGGYGLAHGAVSRIPVTILFAPPTCRWQALS
jgi:hypothetical protein